MESKEARFPAIKIKFRLSGRVCYAALLPTQYYVNFEFSPCEQGEFLPSFENEKPEGEYKTKVCRREYGEECWLIMSSLTEHTIHTCNDMLIHYDPICPNAEALWKDLPERAQQFRERMESLNYSCTEEHARASILGMSAELVDRMLQVSPGTSKFRKAVEISGEEQEHFAQIRQEVENEKDLLVQELKEKGQISPSEVQQRQEEFIYNVLRGWDYGYDAGETERVGTVATEWRASLRQEKGNEPDN